MNLKYLSATLVKLYKQLNYDIIKLTAFYFI